MTKLTAEQNELLDLRDRVFELEDEVRDLRKVLAGECQFPIEWRLRPASARLLSALLSAPNGYRSYDALSQIVSPTQVAVGSSLVKVQMAHLRSRLQPLGIEIATRWGEGYELPAASRRAISAALEASR